MSANDIEIFDGGQGEGGGQLIRISLALCHILSKPLKLINIRSGRPKPGLAAQHLEGILLLSRLSNGKVENGSIGSTNISYFPSNRSLQSRYVANPNTAGSITLMIQISLSAITLSIKNSEKTLLELHGGTNVSTSPSIDHVYHILLPLLRRYFSINASLELKHRGYYPKGGGLVELEILSCDNPLSTTLDLVNRGKVKTIHGSIFGNVGLEKKKELEIEINSKIRTMLSNRSSQLDTYEDISIEINITSENSLKDQYNEDDNANTNETSNIINSRGVCFQWKKGQCNRGNSCKFSHSMNNNQNFKRKEKLTIGAILWGKTDTGCYLFSDDLVTDTNPVFDINKLLSTFIELLDSGACCDEKTTDQLIIYMAVSMMKSDDENKVLSIVCEPINRYSSKHLETSINVASHFTNVKFDTKELENKCRLIQCHK